MPSTAPVLKEEIGEERPEKSASAEDDDEERQDEGMSLDEIIDAYSG